MSGENVEIVRRGFDAFRRGDRGALRAVLAADVEWLGVDAGPQDLYGREHVLSALASLDARDFAPDEEILAAGDRVVLLARGRPDEHGEAGGGACLVIGLRDGRIAHVREYQSHRQALVAAGLAAPELPTPIALDDPHPPWAGGAGSDEVNGLVPFTHVADIARSIEFYGLLGFRVERKYEPHGEIVWAWLRCGMAQLMLAGAEEALDREAQGVLFYLYSDDLAALHRRLVAAGVRVGEIFDGSPGPRHEISLADPDGYRLLIAQLTAEV